MKKAMKLVKIKYEVLEPVLDFRRAKDNPILVHPEDNWRSLCSVGADNNRNLCAHDVCVAGDVDEVLKSCDYVVDRVYHTKANQQTMMETFRTYTYLDAYGRLNVVSSTQVPFHVRRILGHALDIPKHKIRGHQAAYRRRLRREADIGIRGVSGFRDLEDRKAGEDHLYEGRGDDRFLPSGMRWRCMSAWARTRREDPCDRPAYALQYRRVRRTRTDDGGDFPDISPSRCTEARRRSALSTTSYIQM